MKKNMMVLFLMLMVPATASAFTLVSDLIKSGWNKPELLFDINETSCSGLGIEVASMNAAIQAALDLWNGVPTSSLRIKRGGVVTGTANSDNPVIYCTNTLSGGADPDFVLATGAIGTVEGGRPATGSIQINGDSSKNGYFENLSQLQKEIVIAHEMGHVLGLGHTEYQPALMFYDITSKKNVNLSQDDIDGVTWLHPRSEPGSGFMGCGTLSMPAPPSFGMGVLANWALLLGLCLLASRRFVKAPQV